MPLTAKAPKTDRILIPEDTYQAVCYSLVDLGTQYNDRYKKDERKVSIGWEIPEIRIETDEGEKPVVISQKYTLSLHRKAKLREMLEAFRGKSFTLEELGAFDITNILNKNCMLQIIHYTSEDDPETKQKVASVAKLYKGIEAVIPENPVQYFSMEEGMEIPENLYPWQVEEIKKSKEYQDGAPF